MYATDTSGINAPCTTPPTAITSPPAPSPKLILPDAVTVPVMFILPVPVMFLPFKSRLPPSCGVVSSTMSFCPVTMLPPTVEPSPTHTFLVSVVYTSSPATGVIAVRSAFVPLLNFRAIFNSWTVYMYLYKMPNKLLSTLHKGSCPSLDICFNLNSVKPKVNVVNIFFVIIKQLF